MKIKSKLLKCFRNKSIILILVLLLFINSAMFAKILNLNNGADIYNPLTNKLNSSSIDLKLSFNITFGGSNDDKGNAIAIDSENNVYIVGTTASYSPEENGLLLLKYNSNGTLLWNTTSNGIKCGTGEGIAIDSEDNLYITGWSENYNGSSNIILLKYSSNGTLLWTTTWDINRGGYGYSIALDSNNNIYITGSSPDHSFVVFLKYSPNGTLLWNTTWGKGGMNEGLDIAVDSNDYIYITGWSDTYCNNKISVILLKYSSDGTLLWNTTWCRSPTSYGNAIAIDSNNYIYITGTESNPTSDFDCILLKYNSNGTLLWDTKLGGPYNDEGYGVAIDSNNTIYLTGITHNNKSCYSADVGLLKYSSNGTLLRNITWGGSKYDTGSDIAIDSNNNIYITGTTESYGAGKDDILFMKYVEYKFLKSPILDKILPNPNTDGDITLNWSKISEANSYLVYRDTKYIRDISNLTPITETSSTIYSDIGLTNGTYYYVIVAKGHGMVSDISNCESITVAIPSFFKNINGYPMNLVIIAISVYIIYIYYKSKRKLHY